MWVAFWGLEPSKITLWASSWWPSSQARVTSANSEWLTLSLSSIEFPNALLPTPCQPPPSKPSPSPPVILFFLSGKKLQKWCEKNYSLEFLSKMWYLCNALIWGECIVMLTQNIYIKISVGSRRRSKLFHFSLSTLETKEENFNILFLLSKLEKCI